MHDRDHVRIQRLHSLEHRIDQLLRQVLTGPLEPCCYHPHPTLTKTFNAHGRDSPHHYSYQMEELPLISRCDSLIGLYVRGVSSVGARTQKGMRACHVAILTSPMLRDPRLAPSPGEHVPGLARNRAWPEVGLCSRCLVLLRAGRRELCQPLLSLGYTSCR